MSKPGLPRLEARLRSNITGDVLFDRFNRGRYATDASFYQIMPAGVVVPRSTDEALRALAVCRAEGVIVTQVVPLPASKSTAVLKYQELLPKYSVGEKPDFVSLEGYLAAQLLIEGLRRSGREVTMESFIDSLEGMKGIDLGVGATMSFGMSEHQASHKVWGTILDAGGNFQPLDLE